MGLWDYQQNGKWALKNTQARVKPFVQKFNAKKEQRTSEAKKMLQRESNVKTLDRAADVMAARQLEAKNRREAMNEEMKMKQAAAHAFITGR